MPATEYFESRTARSTAGREGTEELVHAALEGLGPNDQGNRPADEVGTEEQSTRRRVRLTVRLGIADPITNVNFSTTKRASPLDHRYRRKLKHLPMRSLREEATGRT
jgi:hypothetical protein